MNRRDFIKVFTAPFVARFTNFAHSEPLERRLVAQQVQPPSSKQYFDSLVNKDYQGYGEVVYSEFFENASIIVYIPQIHSDPFGEIKEIKYQIINEDLESLVNVQKEISGLLGILKPKLVLMESLDRKEEYKKEEYDPYGNLASAYKFVELLRNDEGEIKTLLEKSPLSETAKNRIDGYIRETLEEGESFFLQNFGAGTLYEFNHGNRVLTYGVDDEKLLNKYLDVERQTIILPTALVIALELMVNNSWDKAVKYSNENNTSAIESLIEPYIQKPLPSDEGINQINEKLREQDIRMYIKNEMGKALLKKELSSTEKQSLAEINELLEIIYEFKSMTSSSSLTSTSEYTVFDVKGEILKSITALAQTSPDKSLYEGILKEYPELYENFNKKMETAKKGLPEKYIPLYEDIIYKSINLGKKLADDMEKGIIERSNTAVQNGADIIKSTNSQYGVMLFGQGHDKSIRDFAKENKISTVILAPSYIASEVRESLYGKN